VLLGTVKKCTKNYNARAQPLFCSLNLLFRDVAAAVAVVVFLSSLFKLNCDNQHDVNFYRKYLFTRTAHNHIPFGKWPGFSHDVLALLLLSEIPRADA